jgi:hypothetical protein
VVVKLQCLGQTFHAAPVADVIRPDQVDTFGMTASGIGQDALNQLAKR